MKNRLLKTFFGRTVLDVLFSSIVFFIILIFALYNTVVISQQDIINIFSQNFFNSTYNKLFIGIILSFMLAIIGFTITFLLLEQQRNKYITYMYDTIHKFSNGDFTTEIETSSDEDLAIIAENLNMVQNRIKSIIENERLSEKTKNDLITNIAHDLRTPLTSILGYLELLVKNKNLTIEQKEKFLNIAYEKSKKLEILIEDLFSYTKMNYGELPLNVEQIDIVRLLNQLVDEMYPLFEKNEIQCEFNSSKQSIPIVADPKLLARLFENLINNAIKYGKDGKKVEVNVDDILENKIRIRVVNYGKLIPKESLDKLFDKFYRVDEDRSSKTGGTGLGLAIAKSIVDLHKGEIKVNSDFDGTEFVVILNKKINNV